MEHRVIEQYKNGEIRFYPQYRFKFWPFFACYKSYCGHSDDYRPVAFTQLVDAKTYITFRITERIREKEQKSYKRIHNIT